MKDAEPVTDVTRSTRDFGALHGRFSDWLAAKAGTEVEVGEIEVPAANGMSSETVLFDATWGGDAPSAGRPGGARGQRRAGVPGLRPRAPGQGHDRGAGRLRRARCPRCCGPSPTPEPLGTPFFVMRRVDGRVPPDVMPYNFDSWVSTATPEERARLQSSSIDVLARLHAIDRPRRSGSPSSRSTGPGATAMRRQLADQARLLRVGPRRACGCR